MLEQVKRLLGIDEADDALLGDIIATAESRLKTRLGGVSAVPDELTYIVAEIAVIRYNRITNEGAKSQSTDGTSATFYDDDFAPFLSDIAAWKANQNSGRIGKVRFI